MKISVDQAIEQLRELNGNSEIFLWYRTSEEYECDPKIWELLEDNSESLEETIDEYISEWLEELNEN